MKIYISKIAVLTSLLLFYTTQVWATLSENYPPNSDYQVVELKTDCQGKDGCFEDINESTDWLFTNSSATNPLLLNIGPGQFSFDATNPICNGTGYVTLRGSGRDNTIISVTQALTFKACPSIVVENLTIQRLNGGCSSYQAAVKWHDGGSSTWTNVLIDGSNIGWWDTGTEGGVHYWFSSVVRANHVGNPSICYYIYPYYSDSPADTWFYGGEIAGKHTGGGFLTRMSTVFAGNGAKVRMFGTAVRSIQTGTKMLGNAFNFSFGSFGLVSRGSGSQIHLHGGIVNISSSSSSDVCVAVAAYNGGKVHTPGSTYVQNCASNNTIRLYNQDGDIEAPHVWNAGETLPNNLNSVTGQDMFVQTNCSSTGCTATGSQSHLLIYNSACTTAGPWFDVGLNKCRGD